MARIDGMDEHRFLEMHNHGPKESGVSWEVRERILSLWDENNPGAETNVLTDIAGDGFTKNERNSMGTLIRAIFKDPKEYEKMKVLDQNGNPVSFEQAQKYFGNKIENGTTIEDLINMVPGITITFSEDQWLKLLNVAGFQYKENNGTTPVTPVTHEPVAPINGKDGKDGKDGVNGKDGADGKDGSWIPGAIAGGIGTALAGAVLLFSKGKAKKQAARIDELASKWAEQTQKTEQLTKTVTKNTKDIDRLGKQLGKVTNNEMKLEGRVGGLEGKVGELEGKVGELEGKVENRVNELIHQKPYIKPNINTKNLDEMTPDELIAEVNKYDSEALQANPELIDRSKKINKILTEKHGYKVNQKGEYVKSEPEPKNMKDADIAEELKQLSAQETTSEVKDRIKALEEELLRRPGYERDANGYVVKKAETTVEKTENEVAETVQKETKEAETTVEKTEKKVAEEKKVEAEAKAEVETAKEQADTEIGTIGRQGINLPVQNVGGLDIGTMVGQYRANLIGKYSEKLANAKTAEEVTKITEEMTKEFDAAKKAIEDFGKKVKEFDNELKQIELALKDTNPNSNLPISKEKAQEIFGKDTVKNTDATCTKWKQYVINKKDTLVAKLKKLLGVA